MLRPPPQRRVLLLVEMSNRYGRGLLAGVGAYVRTSGSWTVTLVERGRGQADLAQLGHWHGDGILARIDHRKLATAIGATGLPAVDLCGERLLPEAPWVECDDRGVAELALSHLAARGFREFAYVGDRRFDWSRSRQRFITDGARAQGRSCRTIDLAQGGEALGRWLASLPRPCGIIACYDLAGMQVLAAARRQHIPVPDSLAVVGVDDDEAVCALCDPPLSSIALDAQGAGMRACRLLDAMIDGAAPASLRNLLPPLRLIERESTAGTAIEDPQLLRAVQAMRTHAGRGMPVLAAARAGGLSRRSFELKLRAALGRSPGEEIARLRLAAIARLFAETRLSLREVAERCGFRHAEYLHVFVRRMTGLTPGAWRRQLAGSGAHARNATAR